MRMPSIFIGHGSPMNAIEENEFTKEWKKLGERFKPKAILMISGHWYKNDLYTQDILMPQKKNDMYGFPEELYALEYSVNGDQNLTRKIQESLGGNVKIDNSWGIDHGTWSVLVHMYPNADIPVVQLSIDVSKNPKEQLKVGKALSKLRDQGYMILGSGNVVHNLREMTMHEDKPTVWADKFDDYIEDAINQRDYNKCIDYLDFGVDAKRSVPSPDHYYPLLNILGSVNDDDQITVFNKGVMLGCVSMTSYLFTV